MPALAVAQIVPDTEAEGPGRRFAIWVQGCPLRCPGCCNPEMLPAAGDVDSGWWRQRPEELAAQVIAGPSEGISLLGGEPFTQAAPLAQLARAVRDVGKTVMIYSGYRLDELRSQARDDAGVAALLAECDLLVDGRYDRTQPERARRWIGSRNQLMHFLSDAYAPDDPRLRAPNTVEIRLTDGQVVVNGWPGELAQQLARSKPRRWTRADGSVVAADTEPAPGGRR